MQDFTACTCKKNEKRSCPEVCVIRLRCRISLHWRGKGEGSKGRREWDQVMAGGGSEGSRIAGKCFL